MFRKIGLALVALALFASPGLTVPAGVSPLTSFASQAFFAIGGNTAISLAARMGWRLTPQDFGAKCDGSTNDLAAFNAAIAAINSGATSRLSIPPGTCVVSGALTAISAPYVTISGAGQYATQIVQTMDGVDTLHWSAATPTTTQVYGGVLKDIWLRRTAATTSGAGLRLTRVNGFSMSNVDIRDFYQDFLIEGGSGITAANTIMTGGQYFASLLSGSNLLRIKSAALTSGYEWPSEVFFSNFDHKAATTNRLDTAYVIEGCDGCFFSGGHMGFGANAQVTLAPTVNGVGIQSVVFSGSSIDGNIAGAVGLSIPALTVSGSFIKDISVVGGNIEDVTGNAVDIREPTAEVRIDANIRNIGGWGVYNSASRKVALSGQISNVGNALTAAVTISQGTPGVVGWTGIGGVASANQAVVFSTSGTLPSPLVAGTYYYVTSLGTNSFSVSATSGGSAIATTTAGSGTQQATLVTAGAIYNGTINEMLLSGLSLTQVYGPAFTQPTNLGPYGNVDVAGSHSDGSELAIAGVGSLPGPSFNTIMGTVSQYARAAGCAAGGAYAACYGAYGFAWGNGVVAGAYGSQAFGIGVTASGYFSNVTGANTTDRGREGAVIWGGGGPSQGRVQGVKQLLWATATGTSAVRLTTDGAAARGMTGNGGNCLNMPLASSATFSIQIVAKDLTTPANTYHLTYPSAALDVGATAATTTFASTGYLTPTTGPAGASTAVSADTTNSCLNITWTPPTSNSDAWYVAATVEGVEVAN